MNDDPSVLDQAIGWHLRLPLADETGWEAFTAWLEASPAHAAAYDQVALADALLGESEALSQIAIPAIDAGVNDNRPLARPRGRWLIGAAGAVAAAVGALALLPGLGQHAGSSVYETAAGVARTVDLADGSRVELGGGSRLSVAGADTRMASLERGEAVFHVRHDASRTFTVAVNDVSVQDLGTVFSVARDRDAIRVAVAEGSVAVSRAERRLTLGRGDTALAKMAQTALSAGRVDPASIGGWRARVLTFQGEPLSTVVDRLNRLYALHISLGPNLSDRPFTGMVQLTGDAARDVPHLAALMGTTWRRDGEGWVLSDGGPIGR